ncbi:MAG: tRNA (adenosine(37)-N6)-threonylcarbamoyltransferase complex ATPase subunit type 1 TsaE [Minwuia sp.]|uniref:tRNA (adenosine(37)-N6)-threonylcarbamoyltransferase complex ATPase subunit type 1 TsaE n=1 Tax=Minwuia sp. TaxID=2493630 RepID=UPI003A8B7BE6
MTSGTGFDLPDEAATRALGAKLARCLRTGDLLLLSGDLGAGKTCLARALIQTLAGAAVDVPSPTFNLAVPYELPGFPVMHYDLYRLSGPDEVDELGLADALDIGAAIVEWPDRLHPDDAAGGVHVEFTLEPVRRAHVRGPEAFMERFYDA